MLTDLATICKDVGARANRIHGNAKLFTARPWNPFDSTSCWWLIPSTDFPAYKYGKFIFDFMEGSPVVGLHMEKGLGESARAGYQNGKSQSLFIQNDWMLAKFYDDMKAGLVKNKVLELGESISGPIFIRVTIGHIVEGKSGKTISGGRNEFIYWVDHKGSMRLTKEKSGIFSGEHVCAGGSAMRALKSLDGLPEAISDFMSDDWLWMDFCILANLDDFKGDSLSVYTNFLSKMEQWVTP